MKRIPLKKNIAPRKKEAKGGVGDKNPSARKEKAEERRKLGKGKQDHDEERAKGFASPDGLREGYEKLNLDKNKKRQKTKGILARRRPNTGATRMSEPFSNSLRGGTDVTTLRRQTYDT